MKSTVESLELTLHDIGAVKFGEFTLKSGMKSPIYLDLRLLVSYPEALKLVASRLAALTSGLEFDRIAAVPYAAMPIGTALSLATGKPMIYTRKEAKDYGTKKLVEGEFQKGEKALLLDDLVTTAKSKFEAIEPLSDAGLTVRDVAVVIDRQQGGREELEKAGLRLHSLLTITGFLDVLSKEGRISAGQREEVLHFIGNGA